MKVSDWQHLNPLINLGSQKRQTVHPDSSTPFNLRRILANKSKLNLIKYLAITTNLQKI